MPNWFGSSSKGSSKESKEEKAHRTFGEKNASTLKDLPATIKLIQEVLDGTSNKSVYDVLFTQPKLRGPARHWPQEVKTIETCMSMMTDKSFKAYLRVENPSWDQSDFQDTAQKHVWADFDTRTGDPEGRYEKSVRSLLQEMLKVPLQTAAQPGTSRMAATEGGGESGAQSSGFGDYDPEEHEEECPGDTVQESHSLV